MEEKCITNTISEIHSEAYRNPEVRLIITDLDGTLLTSEKTLSEYTFQTILAARRRGILFGIATGRSLEALSMLLPKWNLPDYVDVMLGSNGVEYLDRDGYVEKSNQLQGTYMLEIYDKARCFDVSCGVFDDENREIVVDRVNASIIRIAASNQYTYREEHLEEWLPGKVFKKFFLAGEKELMRQNKDYFMSLSTEHYKGVYSGGRMMEFMDANVSKSSGIKKICRHHGFTMEQVIALGDSDNDADMLQHAGIGVCMKNGNDGVKGRADYITKATNDEDGWPAFVDSYLGLNVKYQLLEGGAAWKQ